MTRSDSLDRLRRLARHSPAILFPDREAFDSAYLARKYGLEACYHVSEGRTVEARGFARLATALALQAVGLGRNL